MISKDAFVVSEALRERATHILKEVSFGLEILFIDVIGVMQTTGPSWGIVYQVRGLELIGHPHENDIRMMTVIVDPFISDEALRGFITDACEDMRTQIAAQSTIGNGRGNDQRPSR